MALRHWRRARVFGKKLPKLGKPEYSAISVVREDHMENLLRDGTHRENNIREYPDKWDT